MNQLSGMVKKRNGKSKLIGSSIILNENDHQKRINLLRGSIIAGSDNKKMNNELSQLTNQENVIQNKTVDDLYNNLKTLTPILKTSKGSEDVYNRVYNIIDYLRTNRPISRDQYHKYIKNIYYNIIYNGYPTLHRYNNQKSSNYLWFKLSFYMHS